MPIYEFRCKKCGKEIERIQKFSDPLPKVHEGCGGALEQLLSSPAIQFKGSGFYITDYARKSAPAEGSVPSSSGSSKSSTETAKSDSSKATSSKSSESGKSAKKKD